MLSRKAEQVKFENMDKFIDFLVNVLWKYNPLEFHEKSSYRVLIINNLFKHDLRSDNVVKVGSFQVSEYDDHSFWLENKDDEGIQIENSFIDPFIKRLWKKVF